MIAALTDERPVPDAARRAVNAAAARPGPRPELDRSGRVRRRGDLSAVLAALAADALDLAAGSDRALLRWCGDHRCTRPFVDRSRGRRRRWCGMKGCGDRAKAAAYRARRRGSGGSGGSGGSVPDGSVSP
jgi:predicted RNA-binding Zn ribbon-like protein